MKTCKLDGCDTKHKAKGFCKVHYMRWRSHGDPTIVKTGGWSPTYTPTCQQDGCDNSHHALGMCRMHYERQRRVEANPPRFDGRCEVCHNPSMGGGRFCRTHFYTEIVAYSRRSEHGPARCGTQAGRDRHNRAKEPLCVRCERVGMDWFEIMARAA